MVGVCSDCDWCGFDNVELCYPYQGAYEYDFIIVAGCVEGSDARSYAIVGDVRLKDRRSKTQSKYAEKCRSVNKQDNFEQKPRNCRRNSTANFQHSQGIAQSGLRKIWNLSFLKENKHQGESFFASNDEQVFQQVCGLTENEKSLDSFGDEILARAKPVVTEESTRKNSVSKDNSPWLKLLEPPSDSWNFEYDNETLLKTLKNMSSSNDSSGLDGLVVSYDTCLTSQVSELSVVAPGKEEHIAEEGGPKSPPYDPLYECAFKFAKTHGFGFVKFVPENDPMAKEEAKRLRKTREQKRRKYHRRGLSNTTVAKHDVYRHPVRIHVPAYSSNLKLASRTHQGGHPRDSETFLQESSLDSTIESMMKDMDKVQQLSKDIREALSADTWLGVTPECRDQIRDWLRQKKQKVSKKRKKSSNTIIKTTLQHNFDHMGASLVPPRVSLKTRSSRRLSCPPSPRIDNISPKIKSSPPPQAKKPQRARSASGKRLSRKGSARQANHLSPKIAHYLYMPGTHDLLQSSTCDEPNSNSLRGFVERQGEDRAVEVTDDGIPENFGTQNPPTGYRSLVRDMRTMMDHGLLKAWSSDQACSGESFPELAKVIDRNTNLASPSPKTYKKDVGNKKKSKHFSTTRREKAAACSRDINNKTNSNFFITQGDTENESEEINIEGSTDSSWLPGVMSKNTNAYYRLYNSLSATIFRESQLSSKSSFALGRNQSKRLPVSRVNAVYVGENDKLLSFDESIRNENYSHSSFDKEKEADFIPPICNEVCPKLEKNHRHKTWFTESEKPTTDSYEEDQGELIITGSETHLTNLTSQSTTRCVRARHINGTSPSKLPQTPMSDSGHFKISCGVRAGSCPNLTRHTSKLHRFLPSLKYSFQCHGSVIPRPARRTSLRNSPLKSTMVSQILPKTIPTSPVGDSKVAHNENFEKSASNFLMVSPCLKAITGNCLISTQKDAIDTNSWAARSTILQTNESSQSAKQKSSRRKCAFLKKKAQTSERYSSEKPDCANSNLLCTAFMQTGTSVNNNKAEDNQKIDNIARSQTENPEEICQKSRSESSLAKTEALNFNNNAGSKRYSFDEKTYHLQTSSTPCFADSQHLPKIHNTFSLNSLTAVCTDSMNNNALPLRDDSPDKSHPNVPASTRRRKWGPVIEPPKFQQSDQFPEKPNSSPRNETLKLPALPIPQRHETVVKPSSDANNGMTLPPGHKACHSNKFSRYESISVGFGAEPPRDDDDDDEGSDNYLGWWEKKPSVKGTRTVTLPPAKSSSQPHRVVQRHAHQREIGRQKRCNGAVASTVYATMRDHPLNKSYVISSGGDNIRDAGGDNVLHLPSAVLTRTQQRGSCNTAVLENESKQKVSPPNLSMERLDLPACPMLSGDKTAHFDLTPNLSLRSPEFSATSGSNTTRCTWTSLKFSTDANEKNKKNKNNNSVLCSPRSAYRMGHSKDPKMPFSLESSLSEVLSTRHRSVKSTISPDISKTNVNSFETLANDKLAYDAFENVSNNSSSSSNAEIQDNKETDSESTSVQQLRELEREISSLANEFTTTHNVAESPNSSISYSLRASMQRNNVIEGSTFSGTRNASPVQIPWTNINNASSMNLNKEREREFFRKRRLHRENIPPPMVSTNSSQGVSVPGGLRVSGENQTLQLGNTEIPMDESQTQRQPAPSDTFQGLNVNLNTPLSLPSRYAPNSLWGNMLSQNPMARKLWSCEDREARQHQAYQELLSEQSLTNQPMLRNGVPYCPTTENYWQTAQITSAPTSSLGFPLPPYSTNAGVKTSPHDNSPSLHPNTEEMVVEGSEINNSLVVDPTPQSSNHNVSGFSDLFRKLDSLLMRSHNQVSRRLEALGESLNARLKQLQHFVERHITQRHKNVHEVSDDDRSSLTKLKHPSIHLKRKASKAKRSRNTFPLNMAKNKRSEGELPKAPSNNVEHSTNNEGEGSSTEWSAFPSIKFEEMGCGESHGLIRNADTETSHRIDTKQSDSPRFMSVPFKRQGKNKSGQTVHRLRRRSTTCSCNHSHTRTCRRRRVMEGTKCNMCLLPSIRNKGRVRRASIAGSKEKRMWSATKKRSTKINQLESILKTIGSKKIKRTKKKSSKPVRRKVRFGRVSYAISSSYRSCKKRATARSKGSKNHKESTSKSRRKRVNTLTSKSRRKRVNTLTSKSRRKRVNTLTSKSRRKRVNTLTSKSRRKRVNTVTSKSRRKRVNTVTSKSRTKRVNTLTSKSRRTLTGSRPYNRSIPKKKRKKPVGHSQNKCKASKKETGSQKLSKKDISKILKRKHKGNKKISVVRLCSKRQTIATGGAKSQSVRGKTNKDVLGKTYNTKVKRTCKISTRRKQKDVLEKHCRSLQTRNRITKRPKRYENISNSNRHCQSIRTRNIPKEKRQSSRSSQNKPFIKVKQRICTKKPCTTNNNKDVRYVITKTGYSSLIRKLKLKYARMCSMSYTSQIHSKPDKTEEDFRNESKESLVNQFRRVICQYPASRLSGLKSILSPLDSSAETVCHIPQHTAWEGPVPHGKSKQDQIHAANLAWGVGQHSRINQHPISAGKATHSEQFGRCRQNNATRQVTDSPPKLCSPLDFSGGLIYSVSSSDSIDSHNPHRRATHDSHCENVARNEGHCHESNHRLQQVDSIDLTRRRLAKQADDFSKNACCCERHTGYFDSFPTANTYNMCDAQHTSSNNPVRANYMPNCTQLYLLPGYSNIEFTSLECHQRIPFRYRDVNEISTTSSDTSLGHNNGTFCSTHGLNNTRICFFDALSPTNGVESFRTHNGNKGSQPKQVDHPHLTEMTENFGKSIPERKISSDIVEQGHQFLLPSPQPYQISRPSNSKDHGNKKQDSNQTQEQLQLHTPQNNKNSAGDKTAKAVGTLEKTLRSPGGSMFSPSDSSENTFTRELINLPPSTKDLNPHAFGEYCSLSSDFPLREEATKTSEYSGNIANKETLEKELGALTPSCQNHPKIGIFKDVNVDVPGSEKPLYLNQSTVSKIGKKEQERFMSQSKETKSSQAEQRPQQARCISPNRTSDLQGSKSSASQKDNNCCGLRYDETVTSDARSSISYALKPSNVQHVMTNESHTESNPSFQLSRSKVPELSKKELEQGNAENRSINDAPSTSHEQEARKVENRDSKSHTSNMGIDNNNNEEEDSLTSKSIGATRVMSTQNNSNETCGSAFDQTFERDGVSQHPYFNVKCPGISTTWTSVACDGNVYRFPPKCNEFATNNHASENHSNAYSASPGNIRVIADSEEQPRPTGGLQMDFMRSPDANACTNQHDGRLLEHNKSGDSEQCIEWGNSLPNSSNVLVSANGSTAPQLSRKDSFATEDKIECLHSNSIVDNAVPDFARDELMFSPENMTQSSLPFCGESCQDTETGLLESVHHRPAFSVYRHNEASECFNASATDSSSSLLENNNNAAESQLLFNKSDGLEPSQKLVRTSASLTGSSLAKTWCEDPMKQSAKCPPQTCQHRESIATVSEISSVQTTGGFEPTFLPQEAPSEERIEDTLCCSNPEFTKTTGKSCSQLISIKDPTTCHSKGKVHSNLHTRDNTATESYTVNEDILFSQDNQGSSPRGPEFSETRISAVNSISNTKLLNKSPCPNSQSPISTTLSTFFSITLPHPADFDEECQNREGHQAISLQNQNVKEFDRDSRTSSSPHSMLDPNESFRNPLEEPTNLLESMLTLGKRKRRQTCNLSDSMAPPRKVPKLEPGMKGLEEHKRRVLQRRLLWQQRRERKFQALREEKKKKALSRETLRKSTKHSEGLIEDQRLLRWNSLTKRLHSGHQLQLRYCNSSDADCESN